MLDFGHIDGFDWDDGNWAKSWVKHRVSPLQCEEVFFNSPLIIADDVKHSEEEKRYYLLGQTNSQRLLFVAFTLPATKVRVISARDMSRKERKAYGEADSGISE